MLKTIFEAKKCIEKNLVDKANRELDVYAILFWLENSVKPRKTKDNIEEEIIENEEDQELEKCEEQDEDVEEEPVVKKKKTNLEQLKQTMSKKVTPLQKKCFL